MATIGTLAVDVMMRTEKLQRGSSQAVKQISAFDQTVNKALGGLTSMAKHAGIVGASFLSANEAIQRFNESAERLDAMAKHADTIGLGVQRLRELQNNAALSGIGVSSLNNSMQRFARRLAEAAAGTSEASSALRELGLDASELQGLGLHRSLELTADAMRNVRDQSDKVRLAQKLMGREGVSMLRILEQGSHGIQSQAREFRSYAGVVSREGVAAVEAMNDAQHKLSTALQSSTDMLTIAAAPAITKLVDTARTAVVDLGKLGNVLDHMKGQFLGWFGFRPQVNNAAAIQERAKHDLLQQQKLAQELQKIEEQRAMVAKQQDTELSKLGRRVTERFLSPMERFKVTFAELHRLFDAGKIDWAIYRRAVKDAQEQLVGITRQFDRMERRRTGFAEFGTAAGFSSSLPNTERMARRDEERNRILQESKKIMEDVRRAVENDDQGNPKINIHVHDF